MVSSSHIIVLTNNKFEITQCNKHEITVWGVCWALLAVCACAAGAIQFTVYRTSNCICIKLCPSANCVMYCVSYPRMSVIRNWSCQFCLGICGERGDRGGDGAQVAVKLHFSPAQVDVPIRIEVQLRIKYNVIWRSFSVKHKKSRIYMTFLVLFTIFLQALM